MKKSNKAVIIEVVESLGAKLVNGMYEMTKSQYDMLDAKLGNIGADYKFANNKKDDTLKAIYSAKNCRILKIKIVAEKRKVVKKAVKKTDKKDGIMVKFNGLIAGNILALVQLTFVSCKSKQCQSFKIDSMPVISHRFCIK